ncbi:hypothetical protein CR513_39809, partial [Mucuna pruriens]
MHVNVHELADRSYTTTLSLNTFHSPSLISLHTSLFHDASIQWLLTRVNTGPRAENRGQLPRGDLRMTRKRNYGSLHQFDPEIEKTLNRIRKSKNMHVGHSSDSLSFILETDNFEIKPDFSDNPLYESEPMKNNNRMLKELATSDYPQLESAQSYELKSRLIHLLSKFHGLAGEDLHKHLKELHVVCSTMRPQGILEDYIKMKAFPFPLDGATKDWLYF